MALERVPSDSAVRAAWGLGQLGDKRAVEPLINALWGGGEDLCLAAVDALGNLGSKRAVELLIEVLDCYRPKANRAEIVHAAKKALENLR